MLREHGAPPGAPIEKIIEEHSISQLPYRNWCQACVRGQGKVGHHRSKVDHSQDTLPVVSVDYDFPTV